jgi:hypothetical protein
MSRLTLHQPKTGTTLHLENVIFDLQVDEYGVSVIHCTADNQQVELRFGDIALQNLALQCASFLPELAPQFNLARREDPWRLPVQFIKEVDQKSICLLIRELAYEPGTLADFLWYIRDEEMTGHFLNNMTQRFGAELREEIEQRCHGKNPDQASPEDVRTGHDAIIAVLHNLQRLVDEGQIPDCF